MKLKRIVPIIVCLFIFFLLVSCTKDTPTEYDEITYQQQTTAQTTASETETETATDPLDILYGKWYNKNGLCLEIKPDEDTSYEGKCLYVLHDKEERTGRISVDGIEIVGFHLGSFFKIYPPFTYFVINRDEYGLYIVDENWTESDYSVAGWEIHSQNEAIFYRDAYPFVGDSESSADDTSSGNSTSAPGNTNPDPPAQRLSDSCDKVLASGYDNNNNFFELVANETEDYTGTTIEIGVIKNNKWSIPLSTDSPFVDDEGLLYHGGNFSGSIFDLETEKYEHFSYIGCGCFFYSGNCAILNGENGLDCIPNGTPIVDFDSDQYNPNNRDNIVIIANFEEYDNFAVLNTDTMKIVNTFSFEEKRIDTVFPYCEGVFACIARYGSADEGFYDINGNKVIDLSEYDLSSTTYDWDGLSSNHICQQLIFNDGKCSFEILNDQYSTYRITIDKSGNVIDSEKVD